MTVERQLTVFEILLSRRSENGGVFMEGRFGSIGDKRKPGQLPISLPRHGTAGWWTWCTKPQILEGLRWCDLWQLSAPNGCHMGPNLNSCSYLSYMNQIITVLIGVLLFNKDLCTLMRAVEFECCFATKNVTQQTVIAA